MIDIIGDVHGCYDELCDLLEKLGYTVDRDSHSALPPDGRIAVFLGDLCDRGPKNVDALRIVMNMVDSGSAICLAGNHDMSMLRKIRGADESVTIGLAEAYAELMTQDEAFIERVESFLDSMPFRYSPDDKNLLIVHGGLPEKYHAKDDEAARAFCLAGNSTEGVDEYGSYICEPWVDEYNGKPMVVYGHFVRPEAIFINNTICIDTGCVYGGRLTALKYPELEIIQIDARQRYYKSSNPRHSNTTI